VRTIVAETWLGLKHNSRRSQCCIFRDQAGEKQCNLPRRPPNDAAVTHEDCKVLGFLLWACDKTMSISRLFWFMVRSFCNAAGFMETNEVGKKRWQDCWTGFF
jgi:hypothetical protein